MHVTKGRGGRRQTGNYTVSFQNSKCFGSSDCAGDHQQVRWNGVTRKLVIYKNKANMQVLLCTFITNLVIFSTERYQIAVPV